MRWALGCQVVWWYRLELLTSWRRRLASDGGIQTEKEGEGRILSWKRNSDQDEHGNYHGIFQRHQRVMACLTEVGNGCIVEGPECNFQNCCFWEEPVVRGFLHAEALGPGGGHAQLGL